MKDTKEEEKKYLKVLKQLSPNTNFSEKLIVLIIPFDGCTSCFNEAINIIPLVATKKNIIIVPNVLKRRIDNFIFDYGLEDETIVYDTLQLTILNDLVSFNPRLFIIEEDEIVSSEIISYNNFELIEKLTFQ